MGIDFPPLERALAHVLRQRLIPSMVLPTAGLATGPTENPRQACAPPNV